MEMKHIDCCELKTEGEGTFRGRASVFGNVDLVGDVIEPGAFRDAIRQRGDSVVLLNQHNPADAIGRVSLEERADGLHVRGQLVLGLKSAQEAWIRLKSGIVDGLSIGFRVAKSRTKSGVRHITAINLWEVSLVTFPANPRARVTAVKSDDVATSIRQLLGTMRATRRALKAGRQDSEERRRWNY